MWAPVFLFAFIGLFFFGPFGAVFGGVLGLLISKRLFPGLFQGYISPEQQARTQALFFRATFIMMGRIAKADGHINESEIRQASQLMEHLKLSTVQRRQAIELFNEGKSGQADLKEILLDFKQGVTSSNLINLFIEIQLQVAYADGELTPAEERILSDICQQLSVTRFTLEVLRRRVQAQRSFYQQRTGYQQHNYSHHTQQSTQKSLHEAYRILGVSLNASDQEVKRAYRKRMSEHHPDKLVSKGLPKEMLEIAKRKTQEIQSAYDIISRQRKQQA